MDHPRLPSYVTNAALFPGAYLAEQVVPLLPGAAPDRYTAQQAARWLEEITKLWLMMQPQLSYDDERVRDFVTAVYRAADAVVHGPDRRRSDDAPAEPRLLLFADSPAAVRYAAASRQDSAARYREALAVVEVARRETPFDQPDGPARHLDAALAQAGLAWGICTDGGGWRLYHRAGPSRLDRYFEIRLDLILAMDGRTGREAAFRWFFAFFRPAAFAPGGARGFLDTTLAGGANVHIPLSFTDAAEQVLDRFGAQAPMHYRAITDKALELGLVASRSRTPAATMYSQILREIAQRRRRQIPSRFVKHGNGLVGLDRWKEKI
jgi:hypothetical protein